MNKVLTVHNFLGLSRAACSDGQRNSMVRRLSPCRIISPNQDADSGPRYSLLFKFKMYHGGLTKGPPDPRIIL